VLKNVLEPSLLQFLLNKIEQGPWQEQVHGTKAVEDELWDDTAYAAIHIAANAAPLLEAIREISGSRDVTSYYGRIYRFGSSSRHRDNWHHDNQDNRRVGMSVNLTQRRYAGGVFQLRRKGAEEILVEHSNYELGDATLFRIDAG
jgi:hypothetical protein